MINEKLFFENLKSDHIIIIHGDIKIKPLKDSIRNHFSDKNIHFNYIDCKEKKSNYVQILNNAMHINSLLDNDIFYIFDNIESIQSKFISNIISLSNNIFNYNKYIILCGLNNNKINKNLKSNIFTIRLGDKPEKKLDLKSYAYHFLCNPNRDKVYNLLVKSKLYTKYFFQLISYNLSEFFSNNETDLKHNIKIIKFAENNCFSKPKILYSFLVYEFKPAKQKKFLKFPKLKK